MSLDRLRREIERQAALAEPSPETAREIVEEFLDALEAGLVRAAEPEGPQWRAVPWVKQGILLAFRIGVNRATAIPPVFFFHDRDTLPALDPARAGWDVRIVPGGTTVRRGAHLSRGVIVMPPAFVNVGAWVGAGSMIDSHALVGSCAQIGAGVHLSAAVQIGGVLEPVGSLPVIVEDGAFVGGGTGIFEGTRVGAGAVVAPGVVLTRGTVLHDLVHGRAYRASPGGPLEVPPGAVVVEGSRPAGGDYAKSQGIQLATPVIVKYRDAGTSAALVLEQALR